MEEHETSDTQTPTWVPVVLGIQFVIAIIIFGLSAYIIHGKYFNSLGFAIFLCLLTWLLVAYNFSTLYASSLKKYRIQYVGIATNAVMVVFWLSAMGSTAALRASFKYSVNVEGCYNNGELINSSTCVVDKRSLERRGAVADQTGLSILSAIAGLSALELILFIGCLVVEILEWNKTRSRAPPNDVGPGLQMQEGYEGYRMETPQQPYVQPGMQQQQQSPYDIQQTYAQQSYVQAQPQQQQPYVQQPYEQQSVPIQPQTHPYTGGYQ